MTATAAPHDGERLAAVDLGSNSFHLLLVRRSGPTHETVAHRRDAVRLAAGVDAAGRLDPVRRAAALDVLHRYARQLDGVAPGRVLAVATEAVRRLADVRGFLDAAGAALGHPIHMVSGEEEARLIWRGAVHALPEGAQRRLVVDIGGGSTEFILGQGRDARMLASTPMGCVVSALALFPDGRLDADAWRRGRDALASILQPVAARFASAGWDQAWACAGTAVTLERMAVAAGCRAGGVDADTLAGLAGRVVACGHVDRLHLPGLDAEHAPMAAGGLLVMQAVVDAFGIHRVAVRDFAMRHGLLCELIDPAGSIPHGRSAGHP